MRRAGRAGQKIVFYNCKPPGGGIETLVDLIIIIFFSIFYTCFQKILSEGLKLNILDHQPSRLVEKDEIKFKKSARLLQHDHNHKFRLDINNFGQWSDSIQLLKLEIYMHIALIPMFEPKEKGNMRIWSVNLIGKISNQLLLVHSISGFSIDKKFLSMENPKIECSNHFY